MKAFLILFVFAVFASCNNIHETPRVKQAEEWIKWKYLTINCETGNKTGETFLVINTSDTIYYTDRREAIYDSEARKYSGVKTQNILITNAERDSIFKFCYQMIVHPQHDIGWVTDYAGEFIDISLNDDRVSIGCKYSSIGNAEDIELMKKVRYLTFYKLKTN
jgi:hypothetical protein